MTALFWIGTIFIIYVYIGYPVLVTIMARFMARPVRKSPFQPRITIIIPVYNEEKTIGEKIENSLAIDYPSEKLDIIVASDCSDDDTDKIVTSYADRGISLIRMNQRKGKHFAQGEAIPHARGDIIVFTDASIYLPPDSISLLAEDFADPEVGCVSSVDRIAGGHDGQNVEGIYIRYDMYLRKMESRAGSSTGMSGSFYAARRDLCRDWIPHMSNDFYIPLKAVMYGLRAIVDSEVVGFYKAVVGYKDEFSRKIRTIVHGLVVIFHFKAVLNPSRYGFYSVQVLSHKLFRWLIPFFLTFIFLSNIDLVASGAFYGLTLLAQVLFYGGALAAHYDNRLLKYTPFRIAYYFSLTNLAILIAWIKFWSGEKYESWQPSKR